MIRCLYCGEFTAELNIDDFIKTEQTKMEKMPIPDSDKVLQLRKAMTDNNANINWQFAKSEQKCTSCQEYLIPRIYTEQDMVKYGYNLYEEFKLFMGGKALPDKIIINVLNGKDKPYGTCDFCEKSNKFIITVHGDLTIFKHDWKPIFYHEFHHIYTNYDESTGGENDHRTPWISEYLATEVELMALLGYNNIDEDKNISLSDKVRFRNKTVTLKEYIHREVEGYTKQITADFEKSIDSSLVINIVRAFVYCRSKINFCRKHLEPLGIAVPDMLEIENLIRKNIPNNYSTGLLSILHSLDEHYIYYNRDNNSYTEFEQTIKHIMLLLMVNIPEYEQYKILVPGYEGESLPTGEENQTEFIKMDKTLAKSILEITERDISQTGNVSYNTTLLIKSSLQDTGRDFLNYLQPVGNNLIFKSDLWKTDFIEEEPHIMTKEKAKQILDVTKAFLGKFNSLSDGVFEAYVDMIKRELIKSNIDYNEYIRFDNDKSTFDIKKWEADFINV